jgi:hypothetical protein
MSAVAVSAICAGLIGCSSNPVDETPAASREVMKLTTGSDIKGNLGREVLVEGIAWNASLGAVVLLGDTPIYLEKLKEWQSQVVGERVRVSGILQRFEVPTSRQDELGIGAPVSQPVLLTS